MDVTFFFLTLHLSCLFSLLFLGEEAVSYYVFVQWASDPGYQNTNNTMLVGCCYNLFIVYQLKKNLISWLWGMMDFGSSRWTVLGQEYSSLLTYEMSQVNTNLAECSSSGPVCIYQRSPKWMKGTERLELSSYLTRLACAIQQFELNWALRQKLLALPGPNSSLVKLHEFDLHWRWLKFPGPVSVCLSTSV